MIKSERLVFNCIEEKDIEWLRESRNKYRDKFFDSHEITTEQQKSWYVRYKEIGTDQMFIVTLKSGEKIGTIALYDIDITNRTAKLGRILLLDEFRHYGYAEEMVKSLMNYAFNTTRLYKVKVECYWENLGAIAIYYRAGFKVNPKPIMQLEKINDNIDWKKSLVMVE